VRTLARVLLLVLLQLLLAALASGLFDRGHASAAALVAVCVPLAVGWLGGRRGLGLGATMLSYAVLPLAAAAIFRGVPGLVLKRAAVLVLWAAPPTAACWWLGGRARRPR
jgi:hypothetical protein